MAILSAKEVNMTSLLEKLVSIIAPHRCICCSNYDNVVCRFCIQTISHIDGVYCVLCSKPSADWQVCVDCRRNTPLRGVWVGGEYTGAIKEALHLYKFEHAREAYGPLAAYLAASLPSFDDDWIVVATPTAPGRIRERGYDHARLLAKAVARLIGRPLVPALIRQRDIRQVGAARAQRQAQTKDVFAARGNIVTGKKVLVIDDVCTTGATLKAAADVLAKAGAMEVWGAVVAWKR